MLPILGVFIAEGKESISRWQSTDRVVAAFDTSLDSGYGGGVLRRKVPAFASGCIARKPLGHKTIIAWLVAENAKGISSRHGIADRILAATAPGSDQLLWVS